VDKALDENSQLKKEVSRLKGKKFKDTPALKDERTIKDEPKEED
jgi:hypothetical protein